jgi:outer membrane autotransporter protein
MLNGNAENDGEADTGYGVAYAAINGEKGYVDANINYALNKVETDGNSALGYTAEYDASTFSMYLGGGLGYAAFKDRVLFTPEASLLTTYYSSESYTETSSLGFPDKKWDSYDQWSYLGSLGATVSMLRQVEAFNMKMEFRPEIRAHWLHEFNADMDGLRYSMIPGSIIDVALQAREEDLIKLGTGVRFSRWASDTTEFGLDLDLVFGEDYAASIFSAKLLHRF